MGVRRVRGVCIVLACAAFGCSVREVPLPAPVSSTPTEREPGLRAGFGRIDVTPPPGIGLASFSADSRQARGFRQRLYARALLLEDGNGERLALVVADLGQVSLVLHRELAARLDPMLGLGADRVVLSATHTHSGPGNYYAAPGFNDNSGRFHGFDPRVTEFVVDGLAGAVEAAAESMAPARAGWRFEALRDLTYNRSLPAYELNRDPIIRVDSASARRPDQQAVDSTFALLRVDRCDQARTECRPWGAWATFPIHSNTVPAANDLIDADLHGIIARSVEDRMRWDGSEEGDTFFLLAQGAQGDVQALLRDPLPCREYRFLPRFAPSGPRTAAAPEAWRAPTESVESCLVEVRKQSAALAGEVAEAAAGIWERAGGSLESDLALARAFTTVDLRSDSLPVPVCWPPRIGAGGVGGAERGFIRTWKFRPFFLDWGFDEGSARDEPDGCFTWKKVRLGFLVRDHTLPRVAQMTAFRVGDVLVGTVPFEPTTQVGATIRSTLLAEGPRDVSRSLLVALTNGYALYVSSEDEYRAQHYEGASTLYGPKTAAMLDATLGRLATSLRNGVPAVEVGPVTAYRSHVGTHFWDPRPVPEDFRREVLETACRADGLGTRWLDLAPGTLIPAEGPMVEVQRSTGRGWAVHAPDSHHEIEVRALDARDGGWVWEARWVPAVVPDGLYRVRILPRDGRFGLAGSACAF